MIHTPTAHASLLATHFPLPRAPRLDKLFTVPSSSLAFAPQPLSDEAKEQKLRELREALSREQQQLAARGQQQGQGSQATAAAGGQGSAAASEGRTADKGDAGSDSDEDVEEEEEQARPAPRPRRPGLRRGAGGARLRLGRRKE